MRRSKVISIAVLLLLAVVFFVEIFLFENYENQYLKAKRLECYAYEKKADTSASAYCVLDSATNVVLFCGNENKKLPLASTTKILTAITVIENIDDVDAKYVVPNVAVGVEGSSVYLKQGEKVSIRELLYGLMLRSGNDAAVALAVIISGSVDNFAVKMNETAKKAGAENSNFVNPHGLNDKNHYTTALDLAKISSYAMKNNLFREIVSCREYQGERATYGNKNKMLYLCDGANGIKTGYTTNAGRCLVSSAKRGNGEVICVVLNCGPMFEDSNSMINRAYKEYDFQKVLDKGELAEININGFYNKTCKVGLLEDLYVPIAKGQENDVKVEFEIDKGVDFPIKCGEKSVLYKFSSIIACFFQKKSILLKRSELTNCFSDK